MHHKPDKLQLGVCCVLLATLTAALYWPARKFSFINYDDPVYVTQNTQVQSGLTWKGVAWALTAGHASNWHPLTWLSHMADVQIFGQSAGAHHLVNVLLHSANSLLLLLVLLRLTGKAVPSLLAAALFAWHPLHVESVTWISERKDVLSSLFWLLTLWFYAGYAQRRLGGPDPRRTTWAYLAALICFALGLLSKPMVVTLPFVLLLVDVWPLKRVSLEAPRAGAWSALMREKIPFFALAAGSCVLTLLAQSRSGAVAPLSYIPLDQRVANALVAYVFYLRKTIWPADLAVFYPHPGASPRSLVLVSAALLGLTTWAAWWQSKRRPWLAVGWFWYLGTLVPVIGLVQVGNQAYADRYTYVPLLGIFIAVAWGVTEWAFSSRPKLLAASLGFGLALAAYGLATHRQLRHWENSETLFRRALAVTENNYLAHHGLAYQLAATGKPDEAQYHYERALAILPTYYEAHLNLGILLLAKGALDPAAEHLLLALQFNPDSVEGHYNYGVVLGRQGKDGAAIVEFNKAAKLQPEHLNAHYNLGLALAKLGRPQEAERHYRQAIRLGELRAVGADARLALPHYNLGLLLQQEGRSAEAQEHFDQAARLRAMLPPSRN
jgi:protein O-mannosyl-transferase